MKVCAYGDSLLMWMNSTRNQESKMPNWPHIKLWSWILSPSLKNFSVFHIKREYNQFTDGLSSLSTIICFKATEPYQDFEVGRLHQPAYESNFEILQIVDDEPPWYQGIKDNLKTREYPKTMSKMQKVIQWMSSSNIILASILYRWGFRS